MIAPQIHEKFYPSVQLFYHSTDELYYAHLPKSIYSETDILNYPLGRKLLDKYKDIPKIEIENHNNIEEMRKKENKEFPNMKQNLILGIRKTHKFVENNKTSDYLVPYTSSRMYRNVFILLFGV